MSWTIEPGLIVRPMQPKDFHFITELRMNHNKYFINPVTSYKDSYEYLNKVLNNPFDLVYVIEREDIPCKWDMVGTFSIDDPTKTWNQAEFGRCMVTDKYKGIGVFAKAAKFILELQKKFIGGEIWLEVFHWNKRAITSYIKLGFVETGIKDNMVIMKYKEGEGS